jgi:putative ABC transport system permease protein
MSCELLNRITTAGAHDTRGRAQSIVEWGGIGRSREWILSSATQKASSDSCSIGYREIFSGGRRHKSQLPRPGLKAASTRNDIGKTAVFKHYLLTAWRNLTLHKLTTAFNLLGLSFGLIAFATAYGVALYFSQGDLYHEKSARTFVLMQKNQATGEKWTVGLEPFSGVALAPLVKENFPELEHVARLSLPHEFTVATENAQLFVEGSYADADLLEVFDFEFAHGDRRAALTLPNSVVVRDELALRIWGRLDVIGETLLLNNKVSLHVAGVMRAPREPSHLVKTIAGGGFGFSMLISMNVREVFFGHFDQSTAYPDFTMPSVRTYLVAPTSPNNYLDTVRQRLSTFGEQHLPSRFGKASFSILPVPEFRQAFMELSWGLSNTGVSYTFAMLAMGGLVLLVACINYANLTAAHASTRTKELAMRRVVGATHTQIAAQAFLEAMLLSIAAGVMALAALPVVGAAIQASLGLDIRLALLQSTTFALVWLIAIVCTALIASWYPILVMARIRPAQALQGSKGIRSRRPVLRFLVVVQFATAAFLLIASGLMRAQNDSLWKLADRLQSDPIVVIRNNLRELNIKPETIKNDLRAQAGIHSVSGISVAPGGYAGPVYRLVMANAEPTSHHWLAFRPMVDSDFFTTMDVPLLAGRNFSAGIATDLSNDPSRDGYGSWYGNMVIDRAMAEQYGWANPQDAVGKHIFLPTSAAMNAPGGPVTVIGVVENRTIYPFAVLGSNSTAYSYNADESSNVLVRIPKQHLEQGLKAIDSVWKSLAPGVPIKREFVDERFEQSYRQMSAMSESSSVLGVLTMIVAIMGLMGIATHAIAQRVFEIGVRRTLGASVSQILRMLLRDFSKPIIIANVVAWPFAYVAAQIYSRQFTEQIPISVVPFVLTLFVGLGIAWSVILRQAVRAARMNPAMVLRHE